MSTILKVVGFILKIFGAAYALLLAVGIPGTLLSGEEGRFVAAFSTAISAALYFGVYKLGCWLMAKAQPPKQESVSVAEEDDDDDNYDYEDEDDEGYGYEDEEDEPEEDSIETAVAAELGGHQQEGGAAGMSLEEQIAEEMRRKKEE